MCVRSWCLLVEIRKSMHIRRNVPLMNFVCHSCVSVACSNSANRRIGNYSDVVKCICQELVFNFDEVKALIVKGKERLFRWFCEARRTHSKPTAWEAFENSCDRESFESLSLSLNNRRARHTRSGYLDVVCDTEYWCK